jgi:tetratricopeptide (TPR) repeat protein
MDVLAIIGIIAAIVGITAGVVQVLDYIQKRREKPALGQEQLQPADTSDRPSADLYSTYEAGLRRLVDRLGKDHPHYDEALIYQQRLAENLAETRQHGDTDTRRADRSEIVEQINRLALSEIGISFGELCSQATPLAGQELASRRVPHNLPPHSEFIGRQAEKARVHEALRSRSYLVSIDGIGGIGKTSLALEVVYECLQARRENKPDGDMAIFEGFIWATAKDRDLTLNVLLDAVARTLDYPGIAQQPLEEKQTRVQKLLREKPYLLIVDNFETVTDDGVRDFLLRLPEPSKALITARTQEQRLGQAWAVSLKELTRAEALALIRYDGKRLGLASLEQAGDDVLVRLYRATGGAPLAIKWAVGQIKQKGQSLDTALAALHEARGSIFDSIFARSWDLLSADARQVLAVMPIFATSASRAGIEAAGDVHHFALDEALGQLVEMSLMNATDELDLARRRYSIHPLTRAFSEAKLKAEPEAGRAAQARLARFFQAFAEKNGGLWNQEGFAQLELELLNILANIQWCRERREQGFADLFMSIFLNIADFLIIRGYWNDAMTLGQQAVAMATESGDEVNAAWFRLWPTGWILRHRGDLDAAEENVRWALTVLERAGNERYIAFAKRNLGLILQGRGNRDQAQRLLEEALAYFRAAGVEQEHSIYHATARLAQLLLEKGDGEAAWTLCHDALPAARKFNDPERVAALLSVLGSVADRRGDLEQAKTLWEEALTNMKRANRLDGIADCLLELARLEIKMGHKKTAAQMLGNALESYQRLGIDARIQEVEQLRAELAKPARQTKRRGGRPIEQ